MRFFLFVVVTVFSLCCQAMMCARRYDFEVWNLELAERICVADGECGLREFPFQYDIESKLLYSIQGQYDGNSLLRIYDLSENKVERLFVPSVSRSPDYWSCAVVSNTFYIIGAEDSPSKCMYKGRGNVLFGRQLDSKDANTFVKYKEFEPNIICFKISALSNGTICAVGFEVLSHNFLIECFDAKTLRSKCVVRYPLEWIGDSILHSDAFEISLDQVALSMELPYSVLFSPGRDKILLHRKKKILILNSSLCDIGMIDLTEGEFCEYANKHTAVEWVDEDRLVVYATWDGNWTEYDVERHSVCNRGKVLLRKKPYSSGWKESVVHVVGYGKFFIAGKDGSCHGVENRIFVTQDGKLDCDFKYTSPSFVHYFSPSVVVFERL